MTWFTHERGGGDSLWRWRGVGGSGLEEGHVGGEEELAAAVLAEEDRQKDAGRAALVEGRSHPLEHGVDLGTTGRMPLIQHMKTSSVTTHETNVFIHCLYAVALIHPYLIHLCFFITVKHLKIRYYNVFSCYH